jgi:hypothetical protein
MTLCHYSVGPIANHAGFWRLTFERLLDLIPGFDGLTAYAGVALGHPHYELYFGNSCTKD